MGKPIYELWLMKPKEAWYQLSEEGRASVMAKNVESFERAGGEFVVFCESSWASQQWLSFGVAKYPNIEALQQHGHDQYQNEKFRYFEVMTVLGTEWEEPS